VIIYNKLLEKFKLKKGMSTSPYSPDLRKKVIDYIKKGNSQKQASEVFGIHKNTINRWCVRNRKEGSYAPRRRLGYKIKVDKLAMEVFVKANPNIKLSELGPQFGISPWHAGMILKKLGFRYKKNFSYVEADEQKRAAYLETIKHINKDKQVYIDESGIDLTIVKERGWWKKGERLVGKRSGKYYQRTNIIAGYVGKKCIAPFIFNGKCNSQVFNKWIEEVLIKVLKAGQVVIMDNGTFHKCEQTKKLIEEAGCQLIYLPGYSPDLNPIEKYWANMQRWIRDNRDKFNRLLDAVNQFLLIT
jgi:transposase